MTEEQPTGTIQYFTSDGGSGTIEFPLSQYSDAELLDMADTLTNYVVGFDAHTNNAFAMGYISLELNRRLFRRMGRWNNWVQ